MNANPPPPRKFTGRHMAIILVSFFAIVMIVNFVMARYAVTTFGGTVVDNSYVASQKFNGWLADADAQDRAGWKDEMALDKDRHLTLALSRQGTVPVNLKIHARANHPLGLTETVNLQMVSTGEGQWRSLEMLPEGRWLIHIAVLEGTSQAQFRGEVR